MVFEVNRRWCILDQVKLKQENAGNDARSELEKLTSEYKTNYDEVQTESYSRVYF